MWPFGWIPCTIFTPIRSFHCENPLAQCLGRPVGSVRPHQRAMLHLHPREQLDVPQWSEQGTGQTVGHIHLSLDAVGEPQPNDVAVHVPSVRDAGKGIQPRPWIACERAARSPSSVRLRANRSSMRHSFTSNRSGSSTYWPSSNSTARASSSSPDSSASSSPSSAASKASSVTKMTRPVGRCRYA